MPPVYPYECETCSKHWDVVKSVASIDRPEQCEGCGKPGVRRIAKTNFTGASDWNTQTFHPALGCEVKNNRHARQIAKERGLIEVGNEKVETVHKYFDRQRKETAENRWKEADRVKLYD